jgi:hypothetical protein
MQEGREGGRNENHEGKEELEPSISSVLRKNVASKQKAEKATLVGGIDVGKQRDDMFPEFDEGSMLIAMNRTAETLKLQWYITPSCELGASTLPVAAIIDYHRRSNFLHPSRTRIRLIRFQPCMSWNIISFLIYRSLHRPPQLKSINTILELFFACSKHLSRHLAVHVLRPSHEWGPS